MKNMARKLVEVKTIDNITPIPNADAIVCAHVGGWKVVIRKDEFQVGDKAVYFEIDSWIPHELAPFLSKGKEPREYKGVKGEKLRTVKLRGQISQGLLLNTSILPKPLEEIEDLAQELNVNLWELDVTAGDETLGAFPSFIRKTDQDRIQNLTEQFNYWLEAGSGLTWEITEKVDGSSMTVFSSPSNEMIGVCSRNLLLRDTPSGRFWKVAKKLNLIEKLQALGLDIALQGELVGPKVQGNKYNLPENTFLLYSVYDISQQTYYTPEARRQLAKELEIPVVPVIYTKCFLPTSMDELIASADGTSHLGANPIQEGLVYKCNEIPELQFKVISNEFLLKYD